LPPTYPRKGWHAPSFRNAATGAEVFTVAVAFLRACRKRRYLALAREAREARRRRASIKFL
jgi:hypothetical protein